MPAPRLTAVDVTSAWRLLPDAEVGIASLPTSSTAELVRVLRAAAPGSVGVSPVFSALEQAPRALYLARIAMTSEPDGLREFDETPLAMLVAAAPDAAAPGRPARARRRAVAADKRPRRPARHPRGLAGDHLLR